MHSFVRTRPSGREPPNHSPTIQSPQNPTSHVPTIFPAESITTEIEIVIKADDRHFRPTSQIEKAHRVIQRPGHKLGDWDGLCGNDPPVRYRGEQTKG